MAKKKAASATREFPVAFGKVSFGKETVSITATISRTPQLKPNDIDKFFTAKRITGTLFCGGAGGENGQQALPLKDSGELDLNGVFDTKSVTVKARSFNITMSFSINSVDEEQIPHFAQRDGRIVISGVKDSGIDDEEEDADE
jgi:hypothetical protein